MSIRALFAFYRSFHQCINTTTWSFINKYHAINITISSSERLAYSGGHGRKFADKCMYAIRVQAVRRFTTSGYSHHS